MQNQAHMILELTVHTPTITPCSENYQDMHPVNGGAFCDHCQQKVYNVTNLHANDLFTFKTQNPDACVRIQENAFQSIVTYSTVHDHQNQHFIKFALALFIVFGSMLFSCSEDAYTDTLNQIQSIAKQMQTESSNPDVETSASYTTQASEITLVQHNCSCMEIEAPEPNTYTSDSTDALLDTVKIVGITTKSIMGRMSYTTIIHRIEVDTIPLAEPEIIPTQRTLTLGVYPNPASQYATINYVIEEDAPVTLLIYNMQGQLIKEIENTANKHAGTYTENISVADWHAGLYPVILISGDTKKSFTLSVKH